MADLLSRMAGVCTSHKQSVLSHVMLLLNTRQGSIAHLPEYGIPEYDSIPHCRQARLKFINALQRTILQYEPRISALELKEVITDRVGCVLHVQLKAQFVTPKPLSVQAFLLSGGEVVLCETEGSEEPT